MKKGDKVLLPFGGEGKITKIKDVLWGCNVWVKITKDSLFYKKGDIEDFKKDQLKLV